MNVVIISTGFSNLSSIYWSIKRIGYNPIISSDSKIIKNSSKLILPGVGTPSFVMKYLHEKNLVHIIQDYKRPLLGICLGMQLFFRHSEESQGIHMLDILSKSCIYKLQAIKSVLPHIGWNKVYFKKKNPLFKDISNGEWFYFIHSYASLINSFTISKTYYEQFFSSSIQYNNFFWCSISSRKIRSLGNDFIKKFFRD